MKQGISMAAACALAACASQPAQAPVDDSPSNATAVLETRVVNGGVMGMFPFEMTEKHYVRSNMRRDDHSLKGTGTFSGYLVTSMAGGADSNITRLDSNRLWALNHRKKEYMECPAHGCPLPSGAEGKKPAPEEREPKQQAEEGCTARIAASHFDVKPTGEKRTINGFATSRYAAAWVLKLQDAQKRTTTSTLAFDVWTSPLTSPMRDAFGVEQAFSRAYLTGAPRVHTAPSAADRAQVMPPEVTRAMLGYLAALSAADRAAITSAGKQLSKIQGHPILTQVEWRVEGNACGAKDSEAAAAPQPGIGGMLSGLGGMLGKKEEQSAGPKPILSFTVEVKAIGVEPVHDSLFAVPAGYKRVN